MSRASTKLSVSLRWAAKYLLARSPLNKSFERPVGPKAMDACESTGLYCSVCGGNKFGSNPVLWDALAAEWQLSPYERAYVDRQQGTGCNQCGANLRSIALADSIREAVGTPLTLQAFVASPGAAQLAILEINEAGALSTTLRGISGHVLASYPTVDIHSLPYPDNSFDLVVHSDTLEHVSQPIRALSECHRVLRPGGWICFTVPIIVGRLTRSRVGLPKSFHGSASTGSDDYLVHTEFGADIWTFLVAAGFKSLMVHTVSFPDATAMSARKSTGLVPDPGRETEPNA